MDVLEISSAKLSAQISRKGAELTGLFLAGHPHNWIWPALAPWQRSAPHLFPIVGKLKEDRFNFEGREFTLGQHGFARDSQFTVIASSAHKIVLRLTESEDSLKQYPFRFELEIEYELLDASLRVSYVVRNPSKDAMYFNIGWHPAFVLPAQKSTGPLQLSAQPALQEYQLLQEGLLAPAPYAFQNNGILTQETFSRDALVFTNCKVGEVTVSDALGNAVSINVGSAPHLGVWTKDISKFICLEPWWGHADPADASGVLSEKPQIQELSAGESWTGCLEVSIRPA